MLLFEFTGGALFDRLEFFLKIQRIRKSFQPQSFDFKPFHSYESTRICTCTKVSETLTIN